MISTIPYPQLCPPHIFFALPTRLRTQVFEQEICEMCFWRYFWKELSVIIPEGSRILNKEFVVPMRKDDLEKLRTPYTTDGSPGDKRLYPAIGSDVPSASKLTQTIFSNLDEVNFGVSFFTTLPTQERILICDYLYQCVRSIEENLLEARLHYLEWLHWGDKVNERMADTVKVEGNQITSKMPPSRSAIDDLPNAFEKLHVCGFFQAIGSAIDCLGGTVVGVLGLSTPLRKADFGRALDVLAKIQDDGSAGRKLQLEFKVFLENEIQRCGPQDWLLWATQHRNMFIHRGRRLTISRLAARSVTILDAKGRPIPRTDVISHLANYPDKSDIEAALIRKTGVLSETAEVTLSGVFRSTRVFLETVCHRLLEIWKERKSSPSLIEQPLSQWQATSKQCLFNGYQPNAEELSFDALISSPLVLHRFRAASALDDQRGLWSGSRWCIP